MVCEHNTISRLLFVILYEGSSESFLPDTEIAQGVSNGYDFVQARSFIGPTESFQTAF